MTKFLKSFLPMLMIASSAFGYSNKTFLMPRAQGVNLAMEYTTWNKLIQQNSKFKNGSNFAVTGFYQSSTEGDDLGKYFGIKNKNVIKFLNNANLGTDYDINSLLMIHEAAPAGHGNNHTSIKLDPKTTSFGFRMDFYQDLKDIFKGLYAKVSLPFVYIKNDVKLSTFDASPTDLSRTTEEYFAGKYFTNVNDAAVADRQIALSNAKIGDSQSAQGLADLDILLGYRFYRTKRGFAGLNLGVTVPTGNTVEGSYLFEPIYGNGNHFAFGLGFDSKIKFFVKDDSYFKLMLVANYRYLVKETEKRTVGLKNITNPGFAHYYLIGKDGDTFGTPAANILTQSLNVTPGSQFDGIFGLVYKNGGLVFDLGYNLFWRDSENVKTRDTWKDGEYALIATNKDFTAPLTDAVNNWAQSDLTNAADFAAAYKINASHFDLNVCKTPSYLTHKIYAGLGYIMKKRNKIMVGLGGSYEFADDNNEIENWAVWCKTGFAF